MTVLALPARPLVVLAIGAHPDDIEIGCGGTLLVLNAAGDADIRTLILTGDDERRDEARRAAAAFGSQVEPLIRNLPDARLPEHWGEVREALHAFRAGAPLPDLVLAPRSDDAHQDHRLIGRLVPTVWRGPLVLHYEIPKWDGDLGRPNVYVPLAPDVVDRKVALLDEAFPSQRSRAWWDEEQFRSILRMRGVEAGTRYAEAFVSDKVVVAVGGSR